MKSKSLLEIGYKGLTLRVLILGLIINVGVLLAENYWARGSGETGWGFWGYGQGPWNGLAVTSIVAVWIIAWLAIALQEIGVYKNPLTGPELAVLFSWVALGSIVAGGPMWGGHIFWQLWAERVTPTWADKYGAFLPDWWIPKKEVLEIATEGGAPVPWSEWMPTIAFWASMVFISVLFSYSITLLMRKQWIEIDRLPFPYAAPVIEAVKAPESYRGGASNLQSRRAMCIFLGMLFALLWYLPNIINMYWAYLLPGGVPRMFRGGWSIGEPEFMGQSTFYGLGWLPQWFMGYFYAPETHPFMIMFALLLPLDVLFTFVLLGPVFFSSIYPMILRVTMDIPWTWQHPYPAYWEIYFGGPHPWVPDTWNPVLPGVLGVGALLGLGAWSLWFNRDYVRRTLRCIIKPDPDFEKNEAMPYRYIYALLITSGIILLVLYIAGMQVPVHAAILNMLFLFFSLIGLGRVRGEAGPGVAWWGWEHIYGLGYRIGGFDGWYQGPITTEAEITKEYYTTQTMMSFTYGYSGGVYQQGAVCVGSEAFKAGFETKTRARDIFIAAIIGVIISSLLAFPITLVTAYSLGLDAGGYSGRIYGVSGMHWMYLVDVAINSRYEAPQLLAGFILAGLMMFAKMRWVWFPLNPVGVAMLSFNMFGGWTDALSILGPFTIALIIKALIYWRGAGFWERYVGPFVIGGCAGWLVMNYLGAGRLMVDSVRIGLALYSMVLFSILGYGIKKPKIGATIGSIIGVIILLFILVS